MSLRSIWREGHWLYKVWKERDKMSYSICRILKIKSSGVTGIQIHDRREKEHSHTNEDIDFSKSNENVSLLNQNQKFKSVIQERIGKLNLKRRPRKDATVMVQSMLTSDESFFQKMSRTEQIEFFKKSFEFIQDRYGKENMVSATIHFDEKTPHLHVNFVPVTKDNRLSARDLFSPKLLRELQTDYNNYVNQQGYELERGKKDTKRKGLSVEEFKLATKEKELQTMTVELNEKINVLNEKRDTVKNDIKSLQAAQKKLDNVKLDFERIKPLEGKYGLLNKNKVTVDAKELEEFQSIAQKCILKAHEREKEIYAAGQQIKKLENENKQLHKYKSDYLEEYDRSQALRREKNFLDKDIKLFKSKELALFNFLESKNLIQEFNDFITPKKRDRSYDLER